MQNDIREITNTDRPKLKMHSKATCYEGVYWTELAPLLGFSIKPSGLIKLGGGGNSFTNGTKITLSRDQFHGLSYIGPCYVKH
jgi:hypothetical protein